MHESMSSSNPSNGLNLNQETSSSGHHGKAPWDMQSFEWDSFMLLAQPAGSQPVQNDTDTGSGQLQEFPSHAPALRNSSVISVDSHLAESMGMPLTEAEKGAQFAQEMGTAGSPEVVFSETDCPNLRAGRVPCACTDDDELLMKGLQSRRADTVGGVAVPTCQVLDCTANLLSSKEYHQRHRVCEEHARAASVLHAGEIQRYCQQCGRFHPLTDFDEGKRSCRRKLERHNTRRRRKKLELKEGTKDTASGSDGDMSPAGSGPDSKVQKVDQSNDGKKTAVDENESGKKKGRKKPSKEDHEQKSKLKKLKKEGTETEVHGQCKPAVEVLSCSGGTHSLRSQASESAATKDCSTAADTGSVPVERSPVDASPPYVDGVATAGEASEADNAPEALGNPGLSRCLPSGGPDVSNGMDRSFRTGGRFSSFAEPLQQQSSSVHSFLESPAVPVPEAPLGFQGSLLFPAACSPLADSNTTHKPCLLPPLRMLFPTKPLSDSSLAAEAESRPAVGAGLDGFSAGPSMTQLPEHTPRCDDQSLMALLFDEEEEEQPAAQSAPHQLHSTELQSNMAPKWAVAQQPPPYLPHNQTSRMSFKLYDWNPGDFPRRLRHQIMEWLAHMPSDLEGYIRPGCTVLTLRMAMPSRAWAEMDTGLRRSLQCLVEGEAGSFFGKGRMLVQAEQQLAYVDNGKVRSLTRLRPLDGPRLLRLRPLCVVAGQPTSIHVCGHGLSLPSARLLCSLGGAYLIQQPFASTLESTIEEECQDEGQLFAEEEACDSEGDDELADSPRTWIPSLQRRETVRLVFPAVASESAGTASIELEHGAACSNALPLLVADAAVCAEVSQLERAMEEAGKAAAHRALEGQAAEGTGGRKPEEALAAGRRAMETTERQVASLLEDLGWVLASLGRSGQQSQSCVGSGVGEGGRGAIEGVQVMRLRGLLGFAMQRGWIAVTGRLLKAAEELDHYGAARCRNWWPRGAVVDAVGVDGDGFGLLHGAVAGGHLGLVERLLEFGQSQALGQAHQALHWWHASWPGAGGVTPLHLAALRSNADGLVSLLTRNGKQALAWTNAREAAGRSPHEYAAMAGHLEYDRVVAQHLLHTARLRMLPSMAAQQHASCTSATASPISPGRGGGSPETRIAMPPAGMEGLEEEGSPLIASWGGKDRGEEYAGDGRSANRQVEGRKGASWHTGFRNAVEGMNSCQVAIRAERRIGRHVVASMMVVLLACAGICVLVVHPHEMRALSMSLRRCLGAMAHSFRNR